MGWVRRGQCNRSYACAHLNCCGDCEELVDKDGIGDCLLGEGRPPYCKDAPTIQHWLQQTYWTRGEPKCSFWFEEII